ncbi:MAG: helix-turn-helix transcriptional regulator [Bacteroidetes bacterium]|nr:helix-turn-helix transcriptional regulator [Bacteroidota bacterium]
MHKILFRIKLNKNKYIVLEFITDTLRFQFGKDTMISKTTCTVELLQGEYRIQYQLSDSDCFFDLSLQNYWLTIIIHPSYFEKYGEDFIKCQSISNICLVTQTKLFEIICCKLIGVQRKLYMESAILFLLFQLNKQMSGRDVDCYQCKITIQSQGKKRIEAAQEYILHHLSDNLSIAAISTAIGTNECYLKRDFKLHTGGTIFEFIQQKRMAQAQLLLQTSNKSIREVAIEVGYASISSFSQAFKSYFGITPKQFSIENFYG